ncbi:asparagine synthase (glutamine-hydrolyzing) [Streptomyces sp. MST-110588]|uniref:asparagine synthase (glutamine-hydrolyzing) n=1 Tax=Streptomyces sp. MST-110588 TaxID=2833628 RepID=UPI001F5D7B75|nr:asparagine synthase (glutamine-hydrolyzing) [Streptomyces sp. MST-110588]UNO42286.1 asparagine synthase (glutamine-hydrolyzing) [Streptomyces sp. MST-110588]
MCGITGWISYHEDPRAHPHVIEEMTAALTRRGPDASGIWCGPFAVIGHRRLAVIDPDGGRQPMTAADNAHPRTTRHVLTYSGEIYNHHALRAELRHRGHHFTTRSDTEVVLRAYQEWGDALTEHLEGMYAFGLWDARDQRLLLVRDRLGVKPLFFAEVPGGGLVFGSEPKALFAHPACRPRVDAHGLREAYGLVFGTGATLWSGIREVRPGGTAVFDRNGLTERLYWQLEARPHADAEAGDGAHINAHAAGTGIGDGLHDVVAQTVAGVRSRLERAARAQLEADVPVCALLSGGLDSTVLTALLADELRVREGPNARLRSYAVDYRDQAERFTGDVLRTGHDTPYAAEAGRFIGTDHRLVVLDPHTLLDPGHRQAVVVARDSPIGVGDMDTSLYLLFGEMARHSTVALSGEAADEVFGGYPWFRNPAALAADTFPWLLVTEDEAAMPLHPALADTLRIGEFQADTYRSALAAVPHLEGETPAQHRRRELQHLSLTRWLRQLLHRKDRLSMARGLEVRVPYCDHHLVEYVFNAPVGVQDFDGREKSLLRAAGARLAPYSVLHRPKNHYPATHHPDYNRGLQDLAREALAAGHHRIGDLVDETVLKPCLDIAPERLQWGHRLRLERVVDLSLWLDHYRPEISL